MSDAGRKTSPLVVAAAWAAVLVPLGWGVRQTALKSRPLFLPPAATRAAPPRRGAAAPVLRRSDPGRATSRLDEGPGEEMHAGNDAREHRDPPGLPG